jgi:aminoglycoside phosphotransferase family enzyme
VRKPAERCAIARSERFATAFLAHMWDELDRRATVGKVRDGHGDLRLEHVLLEREVEVVDCAEFDAGLRRIDVATRLGVPCHGAARGPTSGAGGGAGERLSRRGR